MANLGTSALADTPQQQTPNVTPTSSYTTSPTDPSTSLASQTIQPPTANRYGIAQQQFQNYAQQTDPMYQKSIRDATSAGMAAGQMGSGQLRTSYGNLANQRDMQLQQAGNSFLTDALNGSIGDQQFNTGVAQQQQGFQAGQQQNAYNQALQTGEFNNATQAQQFGQGVTQSQLAAALQNQQFGQGVTQSQLQDQLANSATNRSATQLGLGSTGSPADIQLALSGLYGNQASQAGSALSGMIGNTVNNNAQSNSNSITNSIIQQLLGQYGNNGSGQVSSTPSGYTSTPAASNPYGNLFGNNSNSLSAYLSGQL